MFLFIGYSVFGRSFAYLGLTRFNLYIGDIALGAFVLARFGKVASLWAKWMLNRDSGARFALGCALWLFLTYGLLQWVRGWAFQRYTFLTASQNLVFNIYPLFLFMGFEVGKHYPSLLGKGIRWIAWLGGLYGIAYLLVLNRLKIDLPWAPGVPLFGQPGSALAILGLLVLEKNPWRYWLPLLLNSFVLLGVQVRGEWLAFSVGLVFWMLLRKDIGRSVTATFILVTLLGLLAISGISIPAPKHRGGEISLQGVIARVVAPFNPEVAANLVGDVAYSFAGTILDWRIPWWQAIWEQVHGDISTALFGLGYGYPLWELAPFVPVGVRTPHNVFLYALGYTGWIGVALFTMLMVSLVCNLIKFSRMPVASLGIIVIFAYVASAAVGNFFETPFGAIPFYLVVGYSLGRTERGCAS